MKNHGDSSKRPLRFDDQTDAVEIPTEAAERTVINFDAPPEVASPPQKPVERTVAQAMEFDLEPAGPTVSQPSPAPLLGIKSIKTAPDATAMDDATLHDMGATTVEDTSLDGPTNVDQTRPTSSPSALDSPTVSDEALGEQVRRALEEQEEEAPVKAPERTVKMASPFEEHSATVPEPVCIEPTRRAIVPFDLKAEHTLPPSSQPRTPEPPDDSPPPREAPHPGVPRLADAVSSKRSIRERTPVDIAAALGIAPEPKAQPVERDPSVSLKLKVPERAPGGRLEFKLDVDEPKPPAPPREGLRPEQLGSLGASTERLSKIIPIVLVLFVVLASMAVTIQLFPSRERQEHVELRFLTIGGAGEITARGAVMTPISIETDPPGLLVLFDRQILGSTPLLSEIPVAIDERVAVELSSPYFERYLGQAAPTPAGDVQLNVTLTRRDD